MTGQYAFHPARQGSKGLVVLLPWMFASADATSKYIQLVQQLGWDVLVSQGRVLNLWLPGSAKQHARHLGTWLEAHLQANPCPVVFAIFSGQAKAVYTSLLEDLDQHHLQTNTQHSASLTANDMTASSRLVNLWHTRLWPSSLTRAPSTPAAAEPAFPLVRRCLCGQWFDSSPVDFTSSAGCRMLAPPSSNIVRQQLVQVAGSTADFLLLEVFEAQRSAMWARLGQGTSASLPALFCYSWDDPLADAHKIHDLAKLLRSRGVDVVEMAWETSGHCAHLRHHPKQYTHAVQQLLDKAQATFAKTSAQHPHLGRAALSSQTCSSILHPVVHSSTNVVIQDCLMRLPRSKL